MTRFELEQKLDADREQAGWEAIRELASQRRLAERLRSERPEEEENDGA